MNVMSGASRDRANESEQDTVAELSDDSVDRWDRRFRIEGDVVDALKIVVSGRSQKKS